MNITPYEFGQILASYTHAARTASASADPAAYDLLTQILKGQAAMALDLSKLQADQAKVIALLGTLPGLKAQIADLQAKLAAAPHDDPSVQATVDQMAAALESAMPSDPAPAATEPTTTAASAAATADPAPSAVSAEPGSSTI